MVPERLDCVGRQIHAASALARLGFTKLEVASGLDQGALDPQDASVQINVPPLKAEQLPLSRARCHRQD